MERKIYNLTQHKATAEQRAAGVIDLPPEAQDKVRGLLTFKKIPTRQELTRRAIEIANIVKELDADAVMIGGAPFFMPVLERALKEYGQVGKFIGVKILYAFSKRESVEEKMPDGTVRKTMVCRHLGFVKA